MALIRALAGAFLPALGSMLVFLVGTFISLITANMGSGSMGPGFGILFILIGIVLVGIFVWFVSFIILLCAGFSWKLELWLTGVPMVLCFLVWWVLHQA